MHCMKADFLSFTRLSFICDLYYSFWLFLDCSLDKEECEVTTGVQSHPAQDSYRRFSVSLEQQTVGPFSVACLPEDI